MPLPPSLITPLALVSQASPLHFGFSLNAQWSPPGQFLIPPKVIGLNEVRAGQLYSLGGWPSPCPMPQTELILFLVLRGAFIVGLWVAGVSRA